VSTAFQHATLGSRRPPLRLDAAVNHFDDQVATAVPETISPILRLMASPHAFAEESRPIGGRVFCLELDHSMVRPAHPGQPSNPGSMPDADVALGQYGSSSAEAAAH
jgi:hypothetical protein